MKRTAVLALAAFILSAPLMAQDAAETAVILSGTSGQGKAANTLGGAINGSLRNAASAVSQSGAPSGPNRAAPRRGSTQAANGAIVLEEGVDALEGTDAAEYHLGTGTSIKVSGGFVPYETTRCEKNCEDEADAE